MTINTGFDEQRATLTEAEKDKLRKILLNVENDTEFVWLYRAEGPQSEEFKGGSGDDEKRVGSWYADSFTAANAIRIAREGNFNEDRPEGEKVQFGIYAIVLPKRIKDSMDEGDENLIPTMAMGREYNIGTPDIQKSKRRVEAAIDIDPTKEEYLMQFEVYRKSRAAT